MGWQLQWMIARKRYWSTRIACYSGGGWKQSVGLDLALCMRRLLMRIQRIRSTEAESGSLEMRISPEQQTRTTDVHDNNCLSLGHRKRNIAPPIGDLLEHRWATHGRVATAKVRFALVCQAQLPDARANTDVSALRHRRGQGSLLRSSGGAWSLRDRFDQDDSGATTTRSSAGCPVDDRPKKRRRRRYGAE